MRYALRVMRYAHAPWMTRYDLRNA